MLSRNEIARLRPRKKEYVVNDSQFLYLRVYPSGKKKWIFRRRVNGKDTQETLGEYPAMAIIDARCARDAALISDQERRMGGMTLSELFKLWEKERREGIIVPAYLQSQRRCFALLSKFHNKGVRRITRTELVTALREISEKSLSSASMSAMMLKMVFDFAVDIGQLEEPHCALRLSRGLPRHTSQNFLSIHEAEEIGKLLRALEFIYSPRSRNALKVMAYTFVRHGEMRTARWKDIDFDAALWTIPAENTKKRREHIVPLSRQVIEILYGLDRGEPTDLVFRVKFHYTMSRALRRLQNLPPEIRPNPMTVHGFRSMASTILNEHEWSSDAIERQLAHVSGGVRAVYNKAQYLDTRRKMMQWYADYLDSLRDGKPEPEMPTSR